VREVLEDVVDVRGTRINNKEEEEIKTGEWVVVVRTEVEVEEVKIKIEVDEVRTKIGVDVVRTKVMMDLIKTYTEVGWATNREVEIGGQDRI